MLFLQICIFPDEDVIMQDIMEFSENTVKVYNELNKGKKKNGDEILNKFILQYRCKLKEFLKKFEVKIFI